MNSIFGYISQTSLFGVLPLDILAHVFVGFILTKIFLLLKMNFSTVLFLVLFIAIGKEYKDSFILGDANTIVESIKDIAFTLLPTLFIYIAIKAKSASEEPLQLKQQIIR